MSDGSLLDRLVHRIASLDLTDAQYLQVIEAIKVELDTVPPQLPRADQPAMDDVQGLFADEPKPPTESP